MDGAYVLQLPARKQQDKIVIDGNVWRREITDNSTREVVFQESGPVIPVVTSPYNIFETFDLSGYTAVLDHTVYAHLTIQPGEGYSSNRNVYFDTDSVPPALVLNGEYGYIYYRISEKTPSSTFE